MRIVIDIDKTIAEEKKPWQQYIEVEPLPQAPELIRELRQAGHYIILQTARGMGTGNSIVGKAIAMQGEDLFKWLRQYKIEYDELWFGKPNADIYVDDKSTTSIYNLIKLLDKPFFLKEETMALMDNPFEPSLCGLPPQKPGQADFMG